MKKLIAMAVIAMACSGCAAVWEILTYTEPEPEPAPICDRWTATVGSRVDSRGYIWDGKRCMEFDDGSFRWTEVK